MARGLAERPLAVNAFKEPAIDYCVLGEGEVSFNELLRALRGHGTIEDVQGIAYRSSNGPLATGSRPPIENLDDLPFPAWDLLDLKEYFYGPLRTLENPVQVHREAVPILSSRG